MMQQETGELKESEDGKVESETPTDDEEIVTEIERLPIFQILISVRNRL